MTLITFGFNLMNVVLPFPVVYYRNKNHASTLVFLISVVIHSQILTKQTQALC